MEQIDVFDLNLNRIGVLQTWISLVWREEYAAEGKFQLEVQQTKGAAELLKPWRYCQLRGRDTIMIIQSAQCSDNRIIVNGATALWVLEKRVSTQEVSGVNAEAGLRSVVLNMTPWPCLELGELSGVADKFENQTSNDTVLEYCKTIGAAVDMGVRIRRREQTLLFECYKPALNTNARYSDQYGNIAVPTYTISELETANVAVVAGAGSGDERITVTVGNTEAVGADRLEIYVDARDVQPEEGESNDSYIARLERRGRKKLLEHQHVEEVKFEVQDDRAKLGDLITVNLSAVGLKVQVRVTSEETVSQRNQTKRSIGLGTPVLI